MHKIFITIALITTFAIFGCRAFLSQRNHLIRSAIVSKQWKNTGVKVMMSSAKEIAEQKINENEVMVFSKTYCPYCTKAKDELSKIGVKYGVLELDVVAGGDDIQKALLDMTGQRTVPNIFVKKSHIGGCDSTVAKIKSGELQKLLKQ